MAEHKPGREIEKGSQQISFQSGVDRLSQRWEDLPHEKLVEMMRATLDEAKEHWEAQWGEGSFDPVTWIGERLSIKAFLKDDRDAKNFSLACDALTQPLHKGP